MSVNGEARSDLVELLLHRHAMTERAIRVSDTGEDDHAIWLPLDHCEVERRPNGLVNVTLPEWLALEKGLI